MTTIACNLREMAAETRVSQEGIGIDRYSSVKVFSANGILWGVTGAECTGQLIALDWLKEGAIPANRPTPPKHADWTIIELSHFGIACWNEHLEREQLLDSVMAVGSGRKVALYCMRVLGMTPAQAVSEACKADCWSGTPIYVARLSDPVVRLWDGKGKRRKVQSIAQSS